MSTEKLHIFKSKFFRGCFYPLRDIQTEIPVDYCSRCGGEIYRFDPVIWDDGPVLCPLCQAKEEREKETFIPQ